MRVVVRPSFGEKDAQGYTNNKLTPAEGFTPSKDDGSVASLEEMFDPDRLSETHVPGGFTPPDKRQRAIKGHEFGLELAPEERLQLMHFYGLSE